jgi:GxxExxY protein
MPVICPIQFERILEAQFQELDYAVMKHVFASHNELGRLCDEAVYHNDIAARLQAAGLTAQSQVPLIATHRDFAKRYYLDLVVNGRYIAEFKTAACLIGEHERQVLHYLFLLNRPFGKLINLRPPSVEYRSINAVVDADERRRYQLGTERWRECGERCAQLQSTLVELLDTFGAYLELPFYDEALTWFLGGEASVIRRVPLTREGLILGNQPVHHLSEGIGFKLTSFTHATEHGEGNIRRFFALTPLRALHWLNFNRSHINLITLQK